MVGKICKWMGITKSKDRLTIQHRVTIFSSAINNVNKICVWQQQNVLMSYRLVQSPDAIIEQFWRVESKCCPLQQTVERNAQKNSWKSMKKEQRFILNTIFPECPPFCMKKSHGWLYMIGEKKITVHTRKKVQECWGQETFNKKTINQTK